MKTCKFRVANVPTKKTPGSFPGGRPWRAASVRHRQAIKATRALRIAARWVSVGAGRTLTTLGMQFYRGGRNGWKDELSGGRGEKQEEEQEEEEEEEQKQREGKREDEIRSREEGRRGKKKRKRFKGSRGRVRENDRETRGRTVEGCPVAVSQTIAINNQRDYTLLKPRQGPKSCSWKSKRAGCRCAREIREARATRLKRRRPRRRRRRRRHREATINGREDRDERTQSVW